MSPGLKRTLAHDWCLDDVIFMTSRCKILKTAYQTISITPPWNIVLMSKYSRDTQPLKISSTNMVFNPHLLIDGTHAALLRAFIILLLMWIIAEWRESSRRAVHVPFLFLFLFLFSPSEVNLKSEATEKIKVVNSVNCVNNVQILKGK